MLGNVIGVVIFGLAGEGLLEMNMKGRNHYFAQSVGLHIGIHHGNIR